MTQPLRCLHFGLGRHGSKTYANNVLPKLAEQGRLEVAGLVEPDPQRLAEAGEKLGVPESRRFAEAREALDRVEADVATVATPCLTHEPIAVAALERGMDLFLEKPVGPDWASSRRIYEAARRNGRKAAVNMTARFHQDKQTMARYLRGGDCGAVDYLFLRFSWNQANPSAYQRENDDPYLLEAGVHGLDILRECASSEPVSVSCHGWNPAPDRFKGISAVVVFAEMASGARCLMEGSWGVKATINDWGSEYARADTAEGAVVLDHQKLVHYRPLPGRPSRPEPRELPLVDGEAWQHLRLLGDFLDWSAGRRPDHPTAFDDNLRCMAFLFAAIESCRRGGERVDPRRYLAEIGLA